MTGPAILKIFAPVPSTLPSAWKLHGGRNNRICKARNRHNGARARMLGDFIKHTDARKHRRNGNQRNRHKRLDLFFTEPRRFIKIKQQLSEAANQSAD